MMDDFWEKCRHYDNHQRYRLKMRCLDLVREVINDLNLDAVVSSLVGTDKLVLLGCFNEEEAVRRIYDAFKVVQSHIAATMDFTVTIGVGNFVSRYQDIDASYEQAFQALAYSFYVGSNSIIYYDEIKNHTTYTSANDEIPSFKYAFFKNISHWNEADLIKEYKKIINGLLQKAFNSETVKSIIMKFNFEVVDYLVAIDAANQVLYKDVINLNSDILRASSLEIIERYFLTFIQNIDSTLQQLKDSDHIKLGVESAKTFIDKYYYRDISLNEAAQVANMSESYFSRKFKEVYGLNFSEYLQNKRLETAKELLEHSNEMILDIANKVGFNDPSYFSKRFKERYHQAPYYFKHCDHRKKQGY